jgi:catalase
MKKWLNQSVFEGWYCRGSGAGTFVITTWYLHEIYEGKFFSQIGKTTKCTRFSTVGGKRFHNSEKETPSFAVKYMLRSGNWESRGYHTPVFSLKDQFGTFLPSKGPLHNINPQQWCELPSFRSENFSGFTLVISDRGILRIPSTWMDGSHTIHAIDSVNRRPWG